MSEIFPEMPWKPFIKSDLLWSVLAGSLYIVGMRYFTETVDEITGVFVGINVIVWGLTGLAMARWNRQRAIKQKRAKS